MSTLWACFALPELPLESLHCDEARQQVTKAWAIHDGPAQRPRIVCANAAARAMGIRPGMGLTSAQALLPELVTRRLDPQAQARRLELLGALAYGFSSQVVLEPPDAVLLEIGASRTLFGEWKDIEHALRARLSELGHRVVIAAAPTPAAARVLAGLADGYAVARPEHLTRVLARVPIGSARLSAEHTEELRRIGARTLGDVFVLPRAALARRFGPGLLQTLDWLRGTESDPRVCYRPPDRFERRIDFDYGIAQQDALRFPLQRLARELGAFLQARDGGVSRFVLRFEHDPHEHAAIDPVAQAKAVRTAGSGATVSVVDVGLRKPCRDAEALFEAARHALERAALPAPAHALALVAEDLPPFAPELRDLFEPGLHGNLDWNALAERLRARLGEGAVRELALHADHRPERAWRVADAQTAYSTARQNGLPSWRKPESILISNQGINGKMDDWLMPLRSASGLRRNDDVKQTIQGALAQLPGPPRPLWLLPHPIPFRGRIVRLLEAPERIETGWWDGDDTRRDYAIADLDNGQRAWLFRIVGAHAMPDVGGTPARNALRDDEQGWMLHGWFA